MKLLGWNWMYRKSRQNIDESFTNFAIGEPSLEEQNYCPKRSYSKTPSRQLQKENLVRKSFAGFDTVIVEDVLEEYSPAAIYDLFHGLFAIGTLGSEKVITEPATPTFGVSAEYTTEQETEGAENDLKIIDNEFEKNLREEANEDVYGKPSVCNNHNINYEGKQMNGTDDNRRYVMESPIHSLTTTTAKKNRTSLFELLQSEIEEDSTWKHETKENMAATKKEMSVKHLVNILKQRVFNASFSRSSSAATTANSVSSKKKLHKILQIFDRKVHPEISRVIGKSKKSHKYEIKNKIPCYRGYSNKYQILPVPDEDIIAIPRKVIMNEHIWNYKSNLNPQSFAPRGCTSNRNKGYWIKTDAEYFVLEL